MRFCINMHVNIAKPPFRMEEGLLNISPSCCGQLVKMLITLGPYEIKGPNVAYFFVLTLSSHWYIYAT